MIGLRKTGLDIQLPGLAQLVRSWISTLLIIGNFSSQLGFCFFNKDYKIACLNELKKLHQITFISFYRYVSKVNIL